LRKEDIQLGKKNDKRIKFGDEKDIIYVVNSLKNRTNKILDVQSKVIKQPMSTWVTIINTSKSKKRAREKKKRTHEICLPSSVKY